MQKSLILATILAGLVSVSVYGAEVSSRRFKVGFVDIRKVFDSCTATQQATLSLKREIEQKQEALLREEEEVARLQKELREKEVVLSEAEKNKRQMEIEARISALQKEAERARQELVDKERQLTESIIKSIKGVIVKIAKSEGFDLILEKDSILYGEEIIDLTDKVIAELNK